MKSNQQTATLPVPLLSQCRWSAHSCNRTPIFYNTWFCPKMDHKTWTLIFLTWRCLMEIQRQTKLLTFTKRWNQVNLLREWNTAKCTRDTNWFTFKKTDKSSATFAWLTLSRKQMLMCSPYHVWLRKYIPVSPYATISSTLKSKNWITFNQTQLPINKIYARKFSVSSQSSHPK